jgi:ATP-dependent protease ClpP protease subunit
MNDRMEKTVEYDGQPDKIGQNLKRDFTCRPDEAVQYGLIDEVLWRRPEACGER